MDNKISSMVQVITMLQELEGTLIFQPSEVGANLQVGKVIGFTRQGVKIKLVQWLDQRSEEVLTVEELLNGWYTSEEEVLKVAEEGRLKDATRFQKVIDKYRAEGDYDTLPDWTKEAHMAKKAETFLDSVERKKKLVQR